MMGVQGEATLEQWHEAAELVRAGKAAAAPDIEPDKKAAEDAAVLAAVAAAATIITTT
jgi:hypothetical protein